LRGVECEEERRVALVRRLVARESRVPIHAHQRAAGWLGVGRDVRADGAKPGLNGDDERQQRVTHLGEVSLLVGVEALALVVPSKLREKAEEPRRDEGSGHRRPATAQLGMQAVTVISTRRSGEFNAALTVVRAGLLSGKYFAYSSL